MIRLNKLLLFLLIVVNTAFPSNLYKDTLVTAFWNVENLFDEVDDPTRDDAEYLPQGEKQWTKERVDKKIEDLATIIKLMNGGKGPDILGVCEVEQGELLEIIGERHLRENNYKVAFIKAPDQRGISNGLLYDSTLFRELNVSGDTVNLPDGYATRLILKVELLYKETDTVAVFVNHWPSRRGGEKESEINRIAAANVLRERVEELFNINSNYKILIMGDFNDEPGNSSLLEHLKANPVYCDSIILGEEMKTAGELFNLSYQAYAEGEGSYKYRDDWNMLDQIIISGELLTGDRMSYHCNSFIVFKPEIMVTQEGQYKGSPHPTYGGKRYLGGYSDHFPVISRFIIK
jgi:endonuclease/exonuclease/phosphatase family metal-dependent hydrolase